MKKSLNIALNSQTLQRFGAYPNLIEQQGNFHSFWRCKIGLEPTKKVALLLAFLACSTANESTSYYSLAEVEKIMNS